MYTKKQSRLNRCSVIWCCLLREVLLLAYHFFCLWKQERELNARVPIAHVILDLVHNPIVKEVDSGSVCRHVACFSRRFICAT